MITRRWALLLGVAAVLAAELNLGCGAAGGAARAASGGAKGCAKAGTAASSGTKRVAGASAAEAAAAGHVDDAARAPLAAPKDDAIPSTTPEPPAKAAPEEPGPLREATETAVDVGSNAVDLESEDEAE